MHKPHHSVSISYPFRLSSSPAGTKPEADASDPAPSPPATGTAGGFPPPATNFLGGSPVLGEGRKSCIRTEDGAVIVLDRRTGRAASGASRDAAEAKLGGIAGQASIAPPADR
ncbi:hypothetical protein [Mesorhizobium sp. STM 4661]|uniref:hypothetical protein n=1 Tax=Mesorhizobium sp. STM 4661 TaxID=1297570 RepID=UPI0002BEB3AD|nr:hypothetical protein [Mesorhizobium sp. STM 4661]CCV15125.1 conserved hypothetical protein [Mesorhizobium sp. STM 4661]